MAFRSSPSPVASDLALALVTSSTTPMLLLDNNLNVIAASDSFCDTFRIDPAKTVGCQLSKLSTGNWNVPQLMSELKAVVSGLAEARDCEIDLTHAGRVTRHLELHARRLRYAGEHGIRLGLSISDTTDTRIAKQLIEDLLLEKKCSSGTNKDGWSGQSQKAVRA
ncbi:MAG TPA: PAS domain-containing protein [Rhizomicrobium sp.]|jgi:hypothetical protein|nr:PAS domain-containing protein [Rhizomicrobium sp.]